jgi:hypothetical protein
VTTGTCVEVIEAVQRDALDLDEQRVQCGVRRECLALTSDQTVVKTVLDSPYRAD